MYFYFLCLCVCAQSVTLSAFVSGFYPMSLSLSYRVESTEVRSKKTTGIPLSWETPQISTLRYDTAPKSGNKMSTEWYDFVSLFVSLSRFVFLSFLHTCFLFSHLPLLVFMQIPLLSALVTFPNLLAFWYRGQTWKEVLRTRAYTLCQILLNNYEMLVPIHR